MPEHKLIIGTQNEHGVFDVAVEIPYQGLEGSHIAIMPTLTPEKLRKILAILIRNGILTPQVENGKVTYPLTEKGEQMAQEAKRQLLEDQAHE